MKKHLKAAILELCVSLIIATIFLTIYNDMNPPAKPTTKTSNLLVVNSYSNHAWSYTFSGTAIFSDGSIYTWKENNYSNVENYNLKTPEGLKQYILKNGKLQSKEISDNDLTKIENYINKIKNEIVLSYPSSDFGTSIISIYNNNDEKINIKYSGDTVGINQTYEAQELLKLLEKYL